MKTRFLNIITAGLFVLISSLSYYSFGQAPLKLTKGVGEISGPKYFYLFGSPADSCLQNDTLSAIINTNGSLGAFIITYQPKVTKVSGTVTNKIFVYGSMFNYPYRWEKIDSIVNTNISSSYLDPVTLLNFNYPFIKFAVESGNVTQKATYMIPVNIRY